MRVFQHQKDATNMFRKVEIPYKHDIKPFEDVLKNKKSTSQKSGLFILGGDKKSAGEKA